MAKTDYKSVDEYIAAQPADSQPVLEQVRDAIRKALPGADEVISYQIAAFKVNGKAVIYFAGWKGHYSLYPASQDLIDAFAADLKPYEVQKATLRFPLTARVPAKLIGRIAKYRAKEAAEGKRIKPASSTRTSK